MIWKDLLRRPPSCSLRSCRRQVLGNSMAYLQQNIETVLKQYTTINFNLINLVKIDIYFYIQLFICSDSIRERLKKSCCWTKGRLTKHTCGGGVSHCPGRVCGVGRCLVLGVRGSGGVIVLSTCNR